MMVRQFTGLGRRGAACVVLLALMTVLLGCDTEKTRNLLDERAGEAQQTLLKAREPQPAAKHYNPLVVTDKVWAGNAALRMHRGLPLPARYESQRGITVISGQSLTLSELANAITAQTGIPVRVADAGAAGAPGKSNAPIPNGPVFSNNPNDKNNSSSNSSNNGGMLVSYEGPLSGLLERVAGYFGVNWRYDGTSINIIRFETRVFLIEALPNTITTQDNSQGSSTTGGSSSGGGSSGGGSSGGGSGGSSGGGGTSNGTLTQNVNYSGTIKYWEELKEILTAMLGGTGNVVISPSNGEVTVTTTPEVMRTVSDYLEKENNRLSRQIAINVEVYNVDMARDSDFQVDFSAALSRLDNAASIKFGGAGPASDATTPALSGLANLSIAIINPDHSPKVKDIFQALSTVGDTTTVAQFPMITLNNRPVTRNIGTVFSYVPTVQSSTVSSTTTSTSTTIQTATTNAGIILQLTPRLLDDGRIIMQYSLDIQGTPSFSLFNSCTGSAATGGVAPATNSTCPSVQLLQQSQRSFIQQTVLRSGSTLVIGGVDQENTAQNAQGVGDPFNWLLGGGTSNATARTMVFIAITPQVLDPPRAEQD